MLCKLRTAVQQQHTSAKTLYLNSFVGVRVCIRGNYGCVFLSMFASTQRLVCASLALSLVYRLFAVKGVLMILNHQYIMKGANSYLKAVILTLMGKVFNGVSAKTRAER